MRKITVLATVTLLLFWGCSGGESELQPGQSIIKNPEYGIFQDQSPSPLQFELLQTYGNENEEDGEGIIFSGSFAGPVSDADGNIYLIDTRNSKLMSFDSNGTLRWQTGQEGKGPGDIQRPRGLTFNGSHLYFANVSGSRIDRYDLDGNFISSYSLPSDDFSFLGVIGFLPDGKLVATSTFWGVAGEIISVFELSESLEMLSQFKVNVAEEVDLEEGVSTGVGVTIIDSLIAIGDVDEYSFNFYNYDGEKVQTVTRDYNVLVGPGVYRSGSSVMTMGFGQLNAPIQIADGYWLATIRWPENVDDPNEHVRRSANGNAPKIQFSNSIDLFDRAGKLLYSIEHDGLTPEIGSIVYADNDGHVYTRVSDPYQQIRKYAVKIAGNR